MKFRLPSPSFLLALVALFVALGGGAAVAATQLAGNSARLGGQPPSYYLAAKHFVSSGGEHFLRRRPDQGPRSRRSLHVQLDVLGSERQPGAQQVTFDVTANTTADLDGNGPMPAGTRINIHTDSDAMNSTQDNPLNAADFTQVGSASSSTEIAADGQEVDIFYNDGVNWPRATAARRTTASPATPDSSANPQDPPAEGPSDLPPEGPSFLPLIIA